MRSTQELSETPGPQGLGETTETQTQFATQQGNYHADAVLPHSRRPEPGQDRRLDQGSGSRRKDSRPGRRSHHRNSEEPANGSADRQARASADDAHQGNRQVVAEAVPGADLGRADE